MSAFAVGIQSDWYPAVFKLSIYCQRCPAVRDVRAVMCLLPWLDNALLMQNMLSMLVLNESNTLYLQVSDARCQGLLILLKNEASTSG